MTNLKGNVNSKNKNLINYKIYKKGIIVKNTKQKLILNRLKKIKNTFKTFYKKKYKKQKRYNMIFKTLNIYNKFYNRNGEPEFKKKWRIRKPIFLMSFFFRRYLKRYYGRLRNNKFNLLQKIAKKKSLKKGYFFLRYFENIESLLPIFLTRVGFFKNPIIAKNFIKIGKFFINGKKIYNFNYILKKNDLITMDTSLRYKLKYKPLSNYAINYHVYLQRRKKIQKRIKTKWIKIMVNLRIIFYRRRVFYLLRILLFQFIFYIKSKKILVNKKDLFFIKIIINYFYDKLFLYKLAFLKYSKFSELSLKLKKKLIFKVKRYKFKNFIKYKKTYKPYAKQMAAGISYKTRIRANRFLLNIEFSKKKNTFIFFKLPIWENYNIYTLNKNLWLKEHKQLFIDKNLIMFFLDNFKKSIL